jgi:L-ascorbate metabolism protein UlaG (beta-lactamase superfamily)
MVEAQHVSILPDAGLTTVPLGYIVSIGGEHVYHMGRHVHLRGCRAVRGAVRPYGGLVPVGMALGAILST